MGFPAKLFAATSLAGTFFLHRFAPQYITSIPIWLVGVAIFFVLSIPYLSWSCVLYPKYFTPLRHLPQPPGGSFFNGQLKRINDEPSGYPMREWIETIPNDGLIYYTTILNSSRVLLTNPKALAEVLVQKNYEFVKPEQLRTGLGRILGVGILLAEGDEHKRQRKALSPAFSFRHVKQLYPIFWAKGREMVLTMQRTINTPNSETEKPSQVVEVGNWVNRTTLDIIGVSGMGKDFNAIQDPSAELYQTYRKVFNPTRAAKILAILNMFLPPWAVSLVPMQRNADTAEAAGVIKRTAYNLIQQKKAKLEKGEANDPDILSVALQSGGFSDDDLVNQLMTFLAAGHETTASALTWAILELCRHPDVQTRLRAHLDAAGVPTAHDEAATVAAADLEGIPYLAAVCNEVLRVHPPVALTLRKALHDTTILGQRIPKDTNVILCPLANNLSTDLWGPDAADFRPDRWMQAGAANSGGASSNYAFMTFLHGPRSCIGSGFARAEFMCLLATWVRNFHTELEDPLRVIEVGGGVTTKPKGGLPVIVTPV